MTLYLVRHASAGVRNDCDPRDDDRPLDDAGRSQAKRLADWLGHELITRIVSSPFARCVETVEPLAAALGLHTATDQSLGESTGIEDSWSVLAELANSTELTGSDAVLCSHGDVIPDLIRRAQLRGLHIPGKSGCAKGSVWTLRHWDGERFGTGIYTPIPR